MSRIALNGSPLGTGTVTIASPDTNSDRTVTLPDATGTLYVSGGALGTPSSGTVTNLTGTASININGTVGATTPDTGAFTSVTATSATGVVSRRAATQDGVALVGRAGGTGNFAVTITPTTLTGNRTLTLPDGSGTFLTTAGVVAIGNGGTGSTSASGARLNLGTNDAANLTSGTVATGRLATTGTASATTFLRGDQSWNQPALAGLSDAAISSPSVGQALVYAEVSLPQTTYTTPTDYSFAQWQKSTAQVFFNGTSAALITRLLQVTNGVTITLNLAIGGAPRVLTATGPAFIDGVAYILPVSSSSDTGSSEDASSVIIAAQTSPAAWRNSAGTVATGITQPAKTSDTTLTTTAFVDRLRSLLTQSTPAGGGTAVIGDRGCLLSVTGGVTVPANVFAANDTFSIYNNTAGNITITQGASLTLRQVGTANTGNRTLAQRGLVTVTFISATEAVIAGGGLT